MWFWGALLGLLAGAMMHGWSGAFWGAVIGTLAGLLLTRQGASTRETAKFTELEKRHEQTQKALADIHWRLSRLEHDAALPPSPLVQAAMAAEQPATVVPVAESAAPLPQAEVSVADVLMPVSPPAEPPLAEPLVKHVPTMAAQSPVPSGFIAATENASFGAARIEPPPMPDGPGFIERMLEDNIVAKLGVVILFFRCRLPAQICL